MRSKSAVDSYAQKRWPEDHVKIDWPTPIEHGSPLSFRFPTKAIQFLPHTYGNIRNTQLSSSTTKVKCRVDHRKEPLRTEEPELATIILGQWVHDEKEVVKE